MLIDLKTRLKDLKFGNDQYGYGSSNEPYIQTPIPGSAGYRLFGPDSLIYAATSKGGSDYPTRGGAPAFSLGLQTVSKFNEIDARRIRKFLESSPKGTLFIQKQIGLQLSNPKTEVATSAFGPAEFGPLEITRVYQSANTLAQVKNQGTGVHGRRHGYNAFSEFQKDYFNTVNKQNIVSSAEEGKLENRLLNLYSVKIYSTQNPLTIPNSYINLEKIFKTGIEQNVRSVLFRYPGGPGSVYGIGETIIYRATDTTKLGTSIFSHIGRKVMTYDLIRSQTINKTTKESSKVKTFPEDRIQDFRDQAYGVTQKDYIPWSDYNPAGSGSIRIESTRVGSNSTLTYEKLKKYGYQKILDRESTAFNATDGVKLTDFRDQARWTDRDSMDSKFYTTYTYKSKPRRYDKINALYPFEIDSYDTPWGGENTADKTDLIKFAFEAIDNNALYKSTAILFRAFLKGAISDNNTGQWNGFNYFGRGEKFYTYQGFERTIGFSFSVPIFSRAELEPTYNRLNALMSQVYPDYSQFGLMRAPIIRLTIGDYIHRMAGFLENVNLSLSQDAAWEIEEGYQLPLMVEVQTSFKPIPDDLPRRYNKLDPPALILQGGNITKDPGNRAVTGEIAETKIAAMYKYNEVNQEVDFGIPENTPNSQKKSSPQRMYYEQKPGLIDEQSILNPAAIAINTTPLPEGVTNNPNNLVNS